MDLLSVIILDSEHQIDIEEVWRSSVDFDVVDQIIENGCWESLDILDNK